MEIFGTIVVALSTLILAGQALYWGYSISESIKELQNKLKEATDKINELDAKSVYYEKAYEQMRAQRDKFIKRACDLQLKINKSNDSNTNL